MKFVVERVSKSGGRLGQLSQLRSQPGVIHHTPLTLVATAAGSPHHLTQDVFHLVAKKETPLVVPAQHFYQYVDTLQSYKKGVASFAALQGHSVCVTVQDAGQATPCGYNDKQGVSTWTTAGRKVFTPESYIELVEALAPDWYEVLNDADTPHNASKKRLAKATAASKAYLTQCLKLHKESEGLQGVGMLMPLLGGHNQAERRRWSKWVAEQGMTTAGGYTILGLHTNGPDVEQVEAGAVCGLVEASLEAQPQELPRQISGAWNPLTVLGLVGSGVDIFDSTFPYLVTERRCALTFPHRLTGSHSVADEDTPKHQVKRLRTDSGEAKEGVGQAQRQVEKQKNDKKGGEEMDGKEMNYSHDAEAITSPYEVSLKDIRYRTVQEPLVAGCECYTCCTFTTAYLHHLATVNELLAPVLLSVHNLHHWLGFFSSIRAAVKTDRLPDLEQLILNSVILRHHHHDTHNDTN